MVSRAVVFVPIAIVVIIIGLVGTNSFPSDIKLESILPSGEKLESDFSSDVKLDTDLSSIKKSESDPSTEGIHQDAKLSLGKVKLDDVIIEVEIADTSDLRSRGLSFHEQLPSDQGMLFVYDSPDKQSLWMLHMRFPLDMLWINGDGKVIHIEKNLQPCATKCPTHKNKDRDALYVLEVNAGFVDKNNITKKSILEIISL